MPTGIFARPSIETRLLRKIEESGDCWLWTGFVHKSGYGGIRSGRGLKLAHRVAYEIAYGPIGRGLLICHRCDVKLCVNPKHLYAGTGKDNARDREDRGKTSRGEGNGRHRLTVEQVKEIREEKEMRHATLARLYSVTQTNIRLIKNGQTWKHVE